MIKKCIVCGREFQPKNQLAVICYNDHYNKCRFCGEKFLIKKLRYIDRDFCFNKECVDKSRTKNNRKTCLEKYGIEHYMKLDEYKQKVLKSNRNNNGGILAWNSDKQKQTMIEKYGVDNPGKSKQSRDKGKTTCLKRYGDENYNNIEKAKETFKRNHPNHIKIKSKELGKPKISLKKYNLTSVSQLKLTEYQRNILFNKENFKEYIDNRYEDWQCASKIFKELGIGHTTFFRYLDKYNLRKEYKFRSNISYPEIELREFLYNKFPDLEVKPNYRKYIKKYGEIDIYLPEINIGIEFNGLRWHNKDKYINDIKNNTYFSRERLKEKNFKENLNIEIIQIWGDDFYNKSQKEKIMKGLEHLINILKS